MSAAMRVLANRNKKVQFFLFFFPSFCAEFGRIVFLASMKLNVHSSAQNLIYSVHDFQAAEVAMKNKDELLGASTSTALSTTSSAAEVEDLKKR